jgi:predicted GIY-YIG superfamily endonuclease
MGTVYLLHFDRPYRHARHYLGYTGKALKQRLAAHQAGTGARLMEVVIAAGITFTVARIWRQGSRKLERQLKRLKHAPRLCPICTPPSMEEPCR